MILITTQRVGNIQSEGHLHPLHAVKADLHKKSKKYEALI